MKKVTSQLQRIQLTDMPVIPLWYNGAWAQANTSVWTGWPSAKGENQAAPITWRNWWELGGVQTLAQLRPAEAK